MKIAGISKISNKVKLISGLSIAGLLMFSCSVPDYTDSSSSAIGTLNSSLISYDSISIDNVEAELGDSFVRGFDASALDYLEEQGINFYDTDRVCKDPFQILKSHGVNTIRLRIWNDPSQKTDGTIPDGYNTLARTIKMAKRVKSAGMDLMLDFHYSDTWADPAKQVIPYEWQTFTSQAQVVSAISSYTKKVMTALSQAGATPDYVQIGNEINNGILLHDTISSSGSASLSSYTDFPTGSSGSANFVAYLNAGAAAVRETAPSAKIVLHLASSNSPSPADFTVSGTTVDYDIIGISYYPDYSSHGTISTLKERISSWKTTYSKDIMITECAFNWNYDSTSNSDSYRKLSNAYTNLVDPDTSAVYTDLETGEIASETSVLGTIQNQANVIRHIVDETADSGAIGFFVWGGEIGDWKSMCNNWPYSSSHSGSSDAYLFLPSLDVMGVQTGESTSSSANAVETSENSESSQTNQSSESSESSSETSGNTETSESSENTGSSESSENTESSESTGSSETKDSTLCSATSFTASSDYTQILEASSFTSLGTINSITVTVTLSSVGDSSNGWWASASSASSWATETYQSLSWSSDVSGYTATITSSDFISSLSSNGLYLNTDSSAVGTVTVTVNHTTSS